MKFESDTKRLENTRSLVIYDGQTGAMHEFPKSKPSQNGIFYVNPNKFMMAFTLLYNVKSNMVCKRKLFSHPKKRELRLEFEQIWQLDA